MALYRKYRPATFAEVVGQEHVTEPLSTALDTGRISHAYLFSGPRGCGKTSSARILARSLNCVEGPTSRPCGVCSSCVALAPGGSGNLDVIELDAASHGGVDDTRELRDRAFYAPAESRYRVFIVDEAHMVTTAGFNALLKIVEEPPAHLIFVFATTEPDKVLPTIRSRTHHYPFRLLPPATMRGLLGTICEQEGVPVEEAVYPLVIRAGGGSPRDSLSVLDQLLAGAGAEGVTYPRALALLGVTDIALIDEAIEALALDDGAALFGTVDRVVEAGHDPRRFAGDLLERMRDLILLRAVPDAADRNLVTGPGDVLERMRDQAQRLGPAALTRYAELLHEGLGEMRGATAPRLLLEIICARMLLPIASDSESATLQRLERLERQIAGGAVAPAPNAPAPGRAPVASAEAGEQPRQAPAERPQSGPPRRRGAEALAAIRENRGGGPQSASQSPDSSAPDAASPAQQSSGQRPHPAQRAQSTGPESIRSQQGSDIAPQGRARPPVDRPVTEQTAGGDPSAPPATSSSEQHAAREVTGSGAAERRPADRAVSRREATSAIGPSGQRTADGVTASADAERRPGDPSQTSPHGDSAVAHATAADRRQDGPADTESDALQDDSIHSAAPEPAGFAFSPGRGDAESRAPQSDSPMSASSELAGEASDDVRPARSDSPETAASQPGEVIPRAGRSESSVQESADRPSPAPASEPTAASPQGAGTGDSAAEAVASSADEVARDLGAAAPDDARSPISGAPAGNEPRAPEGDAAAGTAPDSRRAASSRASRAPESEPSGAMPHSRDAAAGRPPADEFDSGAGDSGNVEQDRAAADSQGHAVGESGSGAVDSGDSPDGDETAGVSDVAESVAPQEQSSTGVSGVPGDDALREVEAAWADIRAKVREFGAAVHALLSGASVARLEGETVVLAHQHAPLAQRLANPKYVEAVRSAIQAVLGRSYEVRWEVAGESSGAVRQEQPARPQPAAGRGGPARSAEPPKFTRPSQARGAASETGAAARAQRPAGRDSGERSGGGSVNRATPASDASAPPDDDIPLPDGPDLPDDPGPVDYSSVGYDGVPPASTPEEEREMLAESAKPVPQHDRRDPDEVALELLSAELGATRLEA